MAFNTEIFLLLPLCFIFTNGIIISQIDSNQCNMYDDDAIDLGMSYQQCLQRCSDMDGCIAISYKQKMMVCRMHHQTPGTSECHGYVYSEKVNWAMKPVGRCICLGIVTCGPSDGCTPSGVKCPALPDPANGRFLGNRKNNNNKKIAHCNKGYTANGTRNKECLDGAWSGMEPQCIPDPACNLYLVSGVNGVPDSQLSESSSWCSVRAPIRTDSTCVNDPELTSAIYGRLHLKGKYTGAWAPGQQENTEYVQVDFLTPRMVTAIAVQGRDGAGTLNIVQLVTEYLVTVSNDCITYTEITDGTGVPKVFPGTTGPDEIVIEPLPVYTSARCVRINPITWVNYPSMRFDILVC